MPFLLPILATAASTAISSGIQAAIHSGSSIIMNKGKRSFVIRPGENETLIISKRNSRPSEGNGLYLRKQGEALFLKR